MWNLCLRGYMVVLLSRGGRGEVSLYIPDAEGERVIHAVELVIFEFVVVDYKHARTVPYVFFVFCIYGVFWGVDFTLVPFAQIRANCRLKSHRMTILIADKISKHCRVISHVSKWKKCTLIFTNLFPSSSQTKLHLEYVVKVICCFDFYPFNKHLSI